MKSLMSVIVIMLVLAACGQKKAHHHSSKSSADVYDLDVEVQSSATEFAIQFDGKPEIWMTKVPSSVTFSLSLEDVTAGTHTIQCIDEQANRMVKCDPITIESFRKCKYTGDGNFTLLFAVPVTEADMGCDVVTPPPPPPPPPPASVPFTDVTFSVCTYNGAYGYALTAECSFSATGAMLFQSMAIGPTDNCQTTTFVHVATDRNDYSCNVLDPVKGKKLFPPAASDAVSFAFNGTQVREPLGDNLRLRLDTYGQVVLMGGTYSFRFFPTASLVNPSCEIRSAGKKIIVTAVPFSGGWECTLTLAYGLYEVNLSEGASYSFLDAAREDGTFRVLDTVNGVLPGQIISAADSITYSTTTVVQSIPDVMISKFRMYLTLLEPGAITGQMTQSNVVIIIPVP